MLEANFVLLRNTLGAQPSRVLRRSLLPRLADAALLVASPTAFASLSTDFEVLDAGLDAYLAGETAEAVRRSDPRSTWALDRIHVGQDEPTIVPRAVAERGAPYWVPPARDD